MMSKGRNSTTKRKVNSDNKCFNCGKLEYWGRECILPDHRAKKSKLDKSSNSKQRQAKQNRANIAASAGNNDNDDSNLEPFRPDKANMAKEKKSSQQPPKRVWYLDSCASRHLTNNRDLFIEECDSNLISLGQLHENKITYVNNPNAMTLM